MTEASPQALAEIRIAAQADELKGLRDTVRETVLAQGVDDKLAECLVLAVDEAAVNVIRHAYGDSGTGEIVLQILNNRGVLVFRLTDFAPPVDTARICPRDLDDIRPGGLGVHLIAEVMDEVEFVAPPPGAGNVLEMRKAITAESN